MRLKVGDPATHRHLFLVFGEQQSEAAKVDSRELRERFAHHAAGQARPQRAVRARRGIMQGFAAAREVDF